MNSTKLITKITFRREGSKRIYHGPEVFDDVWGCDVIEEHWTDGLLIRYRNVRCGMMSEHDICHRCMGHMVLPPADSSGNPQEQKECGCSQHCWFGYDSYSDFIEVQK
jgi:hypothetical protein